MKPHKFSPPILMRALGVAILVLAIAPTARSADFKTGFDDGDVRWKPRFDPSAVQLSQHRLHHHLQRKGAGAEYLLFEAGRAGGSAVLEFALPKTRVIDDFALAVSVRSNRTGIATGLRVVLPRERDPQTGEPLSIIVPGESYSTPGKWQELKATTLERQVRERLVLLRARLSNRGLNVGDLTIDRVVLTVDLAPGPTEVLIDELTCGPIVAPSTAIVPAADEMAAAASRPIAEIQLDKLVVEGKPWFPRMVAWHDEPLERLRAAGMNIVWIPAEADPSVLPKIRELGLWAAATPPQATDDDGRPLRAREAAMAPFPESTDPILFWNLGTRVAPTAKDEIQNWIEQVRSADRRLRRPIMLDVSGSEKVYSRLAPMLGASRHVVNTTFSFKDYRDWLTQRRKLARSGAFLWTWVQTEAAPAQIDWRTAGVHAPVVVEPEQIRLQTYAALAAGCRGIGFWKTNPLAAPTPEGETHAAHPVLGDPTDANPDTPPRDDTTESPHAQPGDLERSLILTQLNLELELIGPWLATGSVISHVPFEVKLHTLPKPSQRSLEFRTGEAELAERDAILRALDDDLKRRDAVKTELEATVISTEQGKLLLPVWYETNSQFVPGQLAANDATIVVPGVNESAAVWEISTTGVRALTRERATGGAKILIPKFDQTAIILITADMPPIARLRETVARMAPHSAATILALARAKHARVTRVVDDLGRQGVSQPDGAALLSRAATLLHDAERALASQNYQASREAAENSLQLVRVLQRSLWNDAVRNLSSPISSPHTVCFQTLPTHWTLVSQLGRSSLNDTNLLRSGDFEDVDTMFVEGWKNSQRAPENVRTAAELFPAAHQGKYSLRLLAEFQKTKPKPADADREADSDEMARDKADPKADPKKDKDAPTPPTVVTDAPVIVTTPQMTVRAGQIVHISGAIRIVTPPSATLDGVMIYDTLLGTAGALRLRQTDGWQRFEMVREVKESGPLKVHLALTGLGEVHFDDLRVVPHAPREAADPPQEANAADPARGGFPFLKKLPRFPQLNSRRSGYTPPNERPPLGIPPAPRVGEAPDRPARN